MGFFKFDQNPVKCPSMISSVPIITALISQERQPGNGCVFLTENRLFE